jgi:hypothetical protein
VGGFWCRFVIIPRVNVALVLELAAVVPATRMRWTASPVARFFSKNADRSGMRESGRTYPSEYIQGAMNVIRQEQNHRRQDRKPTEGISGYSNYRTICSEKGLCRGK